MTTKYTTEHLICFFAKDEKGQEHYQIFEKENLSEPMAIYVDRNTMMHLHESFPKPETEYRYFNEMCEIVSMLYRER